MAHDGNDDDRKWTGGSRRSVLGRRDDGTLILGPRKPLGKAGEEDKPEPPSDEEMADAHDALQRIMEGTDDRSSDSGSLWGRLEGMATALAWATGETENATLPGEVNRIVDELGAELDETTIEKLGMVDVFGSGEKLIKIRGAVADDLAADAPFDEGTPFAVGEYALSGRYDDGWHFEALDTPDQEFTTYAAGEINGFDDTEVVRIYSVAPGAEAQNLG